MNIKTINDLPEAHNLSGMYGVACDGNNETKKYELPFLMKGNANNSVVLGEDNNQVISEGGIALGKDNIIGLKGWYYTSIYKKSNTQIYVYLDDKQKICLENENFALTELMPNTELPNLYEIYGHGAIMSIVNGNKYDNGFVLVGGNNGYVILDTIDSSEIPFTVINKNTNNDVEDYSLYCLSQPNKGTIDIGYYSFAVGYNNKVTNSQSMAFGFNNNAYGKYSFVEGGSNICGYCSHAEGSGNQSIGSYSHTEGRNNIANKLYSHAEGYQTISNGNGSHTEGYKTQANGEYSHAEGHQTVTNNKASHAEGYKTEAVAMYSHAEGVRAHAIGLSSHAEGTDTYANGTKSHAEGNYTIANGNQSHAEGNYTITNNHSEHACGAYNVSNTGSTTADKTQFSVGIGTSDTNRKNAFEIRANGDIYIYIGATQYKLQDILTGAVTITTDTEN